MRALLNIFLITASLSAFSQSAEDLNNERIFFQYLIDQELYSASAAQYQNCRNLGVTGQQFDSLTLAMGLSIMNEGYNAEKFFKDIPASSSLYHKKAGFAMRFQNLSYLDFTEAQFHVHQEEKEEMDQFVVINNLLGRAEYMLAFPKTNSLQWRDRTYSSNESYLVGVHTNYLNQKHYSLLASASMSAVVPGLGKLYLGEWGQFVSTLLPNVAFGAQALEGYLIGGIKDPRFIVFSALGGVFYLGNIYSTIKAAKHKNKLNYERFHQDVIDIVDDPMDAYLRTE